MRSKWLDWKPVVEIIEKTPDHEASKPTKPSCEGFVGTSPETFSITRAPCDPEIMKKGRGPEPSKPTKPPSRADIPTGVVLVAPRYCGDSKPLASVPKCWCCGETYTLDRLQESKSQTYAWLKPGCGCLDVPQALACCGLCVEHCRCRQTRERSKNSENTVLEAATEAESRCWHCEAKAGETGRCYCPTCGHAGPGGTWHCRVCLAPRERKGRHEHLSQGARGPNAGRDACSKRRAGP